MSKVTPIKFLLTLIYIGGTCMTIYLLVRFCIHSAYVANPEAMLPIADYENAFIMMAVGCPFMLASAISMLKTWKISATAHPKRNRFLILLPAIVDLIPFLVMLVLLFWMLVLGTRDALFMG